MVNRSSSKSAEKIQWFVPKIIVFLIGILKEFLSHKCHSCYLFSKQQTLVIKKHFSADFEELLHTEMFSWECYYRNFSSLEENNTLMPRLGHNMQCLTSPGQCWSMHGQQQFHSWVAWYTCMMTTYEKSTCIHVASMRCTRRNVLTSTLVSKLSIRLTWGKVIEGPRKLLQKFTTSRDGPVKSTETKQEWKHKKTTLL